MRVGLGSEMERPRDGCPLRILPMTSTRSFLSLAALAALAGALPFAGTPRLVAQDARTGVAHPDEAAIEATPEAAAPVALAKPSAAVPMTMPAPSTPGSGEAYGAYMPYTGAKTGAAATTASRAMDEDEADGSVVMTVEDRPGELREGTLLQARIRERLSTVTTEEGSRFSAELVTPVEKDGRVALPVGSVVSGRVTSVHGGKRISGAAELHLEAERITLPNGTVYATHLQLIDTDQLRNTKIDSEGSLVRRDHPKETLAVLGLAAGGGAAAGGVVGGPVGAGVGAGIGAGVGTVLWLKQNRQEVVPEHALLVFSLSRALPLTSKGETPAMASAHAGKVSGNPDGMVVGVDQ